MSDLEDIIIGIDLGTTNSCVSIWKNQKVEIIADISGNRTMPSIIAFSKTRRYVGIEAKNQIEINAENTIYEVKRLIGRKLTDPSVQNDLPFLSYKLAESENGLVIDVPCRQIQITPEEVSSIILGELKQWAERYLRTSVKKAVITVPAYFNDSQRQATKDAAKIIGLDCLRIINEPTAAALAYGFEKISRTVDHDMHVIIYDLGGGTLDVSLLNISNGVFQVLASVGNTHLGGCDFDNRLLSYSINMFKKKHGFEKLTGLKLLSIQKLRKSCENAKKMLSVTTKTIIAVPDFYDNKDLYITISRNEFEKICQDLFILCLKSVEDVLESAGLTVSQIDDIILVGGATRMPQIQDNLKLFFRGKQPNCSINPDETVAAGAAIQAHLLSGNNMDAFSSGVVLLDIVPLSLGVEVMGNIMNVIIPRNSVIPIKRKRKYTTDTDYETSVLINIYEGEREMTKDNFHVGSFLLEGLEEDLRGMPEIEVCFSIDINGIINVSAEDLKNPLNKKSVIVTGNKGRLSEQQIQKLIEEAAIFEAKDKVERFKREWFYEIEDLCMNIKSNIDNDEFKLKETDKNKIIDEINLIDNWLKEKAFSERSEKEYSNVLDNIKKKYGTLMLKSISDQDQLKGSTNTVVEGSSVFADQDDDDICQKNLSIIIDEQEFGASDESVQQLKELRENLINLCHDVLNLIKIINPEKQYVDEINDYVDDLLLWIHVQEKLSKNELVQKINELNSVCDELVSKHENCPNDSINHVAKKNELEQLCYTVLSCITCNNFSAHDLEMDNLKNKVTITLDQLLKQEIQNKINELDPSINCINTVDYQKIIDEINNMCNVLYQKMIKINLDNHSVISDISSVSTCTTNNNTFTGSNHNTGTSIFDLKNK